MMMERGGKKDEDEERKTKAQGQNKQAGNSANTYYGSNTAFVLSSV
jgi:hypothetical protein